MAINKISNNAGKTPADKPIDFNKRVVKQHEKLLVQLTQAMDPASDGGMVITRPELKKLRKGLDKATELTPEMRAQIEQTLDQADAVLKTNEVITKIQAALDKASEGSGSITAGEAAAIIQEAQGLPAEALQEVKAQVLHALTAKDHWDVTPDARQAFASFLDVPLDKLPTGKADRPEKTAAFTKAHNEARPKAIPKGEFKEIMAGMQELPPELREMATASILGAQKDGLIKLDPDSRKVLTRAVATGFAEGPEQALAHRDNSSLLMGVGTDDYAANYLAQVIASGGSFEEILFAFMLLMAGKAEKEAEEAMEQLAELEKEGGGRRRPWRDGHVKPGVDVNGDGKIDRGDKPVDQGEVQKAAKVLESMVQSAHWATTEKSEGGAQITVGEARKLVDYLERLPANVQQLLAGSLEKALQIGGVPLTGNAHFALDEWASKQLGRPLDVTPSGDPRQPIPHNAELAKALRESDKLEDKVASFIVDALYKPELSLKEKMVPFRSLRMDMASAGQNKQVHSDQPDGKMVEKAKNAAGDLIKAAAAREAGEPQAGAKPEAPKAAEGSAADDFVLQPPTSVFSGSMVPEVDYSGGEGGPAKGPAQGVVEGGGEVKEGEDGKPTKIQAQHRLQMAMNNRQRVLDMLSNIMKAIHDTQMTAVRNLR